VGVCITIDRTESGRFRATLPNRELEAGTLRELVHELGAAIIAVFEAGGRVRISIEIEDDADFERDLEYTLAKNTELYRRLAQ
jgi:hypothetical protein